MTLMMHPRMRRRLDHVERQRAVAIDRDFGAAIDELERQALRLDDLLGSSVAGPVVETCARLRTALSARMPDHTDEAVVRTLVPARAGD